MATYYNGASDNIQNGDGLQTLVLMNPEYAYYSYTQGNINNYAFLDHSNNPGNNPTMGGPPSPAPTQQLVGIPMTVSQPASVHSKHGTIQRGQYMYNPVEMVPREVTSFQQGLSLSLSSQQSRYASQAARGGCGGGSTSSGVSNNNNNNNNNMLLDSKYLKATQEILEEVVNVAIKNPDQSTKNLNIACGDPGEHGSPPVVSREAETAVKSELSTAERQEIQMKKAKLVNMLDEVEHRYRQYHHQMQLVISWFEQAAGLGSAKTYTALALQTISKQFRSLKDTITGQIKAARVSLGEDNNDKADGGGSRLKFVDNQLRQQRALQQLGMIQHNAWRPQRGLPERAVSVLRAWLFEHFLHPYPKDSDKHMLAKQTGLTRSQVSNWFINARVRLWKPMVEEMYLEETKNTTQNQNNPSSPENLPENSPENQNPAFRPPKHEQSVHKPPPLTSPSTVTPTTTVNFQNPSSFTLAGTLELAGIAQFSPKKPRNDPQDGGFTITGNNSTDFIGGYPIGEIGRFAGDQFQQHYSGNGVSLTLGLPDGQNLAISGSHQILPDFVARI
ncbi:BEL1-like homeodomain protein 1 [Bidens hawaiensis]|uniref:BEL1-like homeodomain protein 1 n=1 Tax=Bidens hawaiensis TaxID=980011 RepID=UPI00404ABC70